jgi:DNA ligase-associated metallophosphoesterase
LNLKTSVAGEEFELLAQKAVFWKKESALLLADLHLGKVNHFRKSGIPVPVRAGDKSLEDLIDLIHLTRPQRVLCLGDLFHSHYNPAWEVFGEIVSHFRTVAFELIIGNHDIMSARQYERKKICVHEQLDLGPFSMTHHPAEAVVPGRYNLAGHIHPGVNLRGKGQQSITLPCFYFGKHQGILPAFGMFTGIAKIRPEKGDQVFVIAEQNVIPVS